MSTHALTRRSLLRGAGLAAVGGSALAAGLGPDASAFTAGRHRRCRKRGPLTVAYVEANNYSVANVGDYTLATNGATVFDIGIIFAANINYDGRHAYLYNNPQVQAQLDAAPTVIRPLQRKGIKVLLSVLGNHQGAGFANFPNRGAATAFAQRLAHTVRRYGLDGIDFDDEWAEYGTNGTGQPNDYSFVYLVQALRRAMPDKIISLYNIGPSAERLCYRGVRVGDLIDYCWNPYYGSWGVPDVPGLTKRQLGPAAIAIASTPTSVAASLAERTVAEGYGVYLTYNLPDADVHDYLSAFTRPLYGSDAVHTGAS